MIAVGPRFKHKRPPYFRRCPCVSTHARQHNGRGTTSGPRRGKRAQPRVSTLGTPCRIKFSLLIRVEYEERWVTMEGNAFRRAWCDSSTIKESSREPISKLTHKNFG